MGVVRTSAHRHSCERSGCAFIRSVSHFGATIDRIRHSTDALLSRRCSTRQCPTSPSVRTTTIPVGLATQSVAATTVSIWEFKHHVPLGPGGTPSGSSASRASLRLLASRRPRCRWGLSIRSGTQREPRRRRGKGQRDPRLIRRLHCVRLSSQLFWFVDYQVYTFNLIPVSCFYDGI